VAPVLFLILLIILDFGRAIFQYVTISHAANEGARVAVRGLPSTEFPAPTNADVLLAIQQQLPGAEFGSCPNGPLPKPADLAPVPNKAFVYITQLKPEEGIAPDPTRPNAPGAENGAPSASCWAPTAATNHRPLQVTIFYHFQPFTPMVGALLSNRLVLRVHAVYRTEY
jgi:hypothetical protein